MTQKRKAVVLAAGKGTRLQSDRSDLPKVLREAHGQPLLAWVLAKTAFIPPADTIVVVGYKGDLVKQAVGSEYRFATQTEQLGTGHAVQMAASELADFDGSVLVCYGDMPLIRQSTYEGLFKAHEADGNACTMLAYVSDRDMKYGRILRDEQGEFDRVVEDKDCTQEQKKITELNAGVYVFAARLLLAGLKQLQNDNAQGEYYLTDVPAFIRERGGRIGIYQTTGEAEGIGVNTQEDLDFVSALLEKEQE